MSSFPEFGIQDTLKPSLLQFVNFFSKIKGSEDVKLFTLIKYIAPLLNSPIISALLENPNENQARACLSVYLKSNPDIPDILLDYLVCVGNAFAIKKTLPSAIGKKTLFDYIIVFITFSFR